MADDTMFHLKFSRSLNKVTQNVGVTKILTRRILETVILMFHKKKLTYQKLEKVTRPTTHNVSDYASSTLRAADSLSSRDTKNRRWYN